MSQKKQKAVKKGVTKAFSAGGAVYKKTKQNTYWLLIKPKDKDRWQLPKGALDKGETPKEAALREVYEETGITAEIADSAGDVQYFFVLETERFFKKVTFYLMKYLSGKPVVFPEFAKEIEKVRWVKTAEALNALTFKDEKKILEKAVNKLEMLK